MLDVDWDRKRELEASDILDLWRALNQDIRSSRHRLP